jgi:hypothetical protein
MAVELIFRSTTESNLNSDLEVYINQRSELTIKIHNSYLDKPNDYAFACFDKDTAIKLAKELRKQISFLED